MLHNDGSNVDSKLIKLVHGDMDIFYSRNCTIPYIRIDTPKFSSNTLRYLDDAVYSQFIEDNARTHNLSNIGILCAKGDIYGHHSKLNKIWVYDDSDQLRSVQDWINAHDGKYSLLILFCVATKPEGKSVASEKSSLLLPDNSYLRIPMPEKIQSRLYIPQIGWIDGDSDYQLKEVSTRA